MTAEKKNILIVDDVEDVRVGMASILESDVRMVHTAANGLEGLEELKKLPFDLVISDILMPKMDGVEFASAALELYPGIKFILISGGGRQYIDGYDYLEAAQKITGIDHVLMKPFNPVELMSMVDELLS